MPVAIIDEGRDNVVEADPDGFAGGCIVLRGNGNRVTVARPAATGDVHIELSGGSSLHVGPDCRLGHLFVYAAASGRITIGRGSGFNGRIRLLLHEPGQLRIGEGCLFGGDVDATISDMHSIVDARSGERINPAADIWLGDRVWVGQRATLLKGTHVGTGSVIGASSVVTGPVPPECVAAGNPARVIRSGVTWRHELI